MSVCEREKEGAFIKERERKEGKWEEECAATYIIHVRTHLDINMCIHVNFICIYMSVKTYIQIYIYLYKYIHTYKYIYI